MTDNIRDMKTSDLRMELREIKQRLLSDQMQIAQLKQNTEDKEAVTEDRKHLVGRYALLNSELGHRFSTKRGLRAARQMEE